ncbi:MAG: 3-dehydro-L-gulonate 2-dehydrogenase [Spirochaetales bacterium]|nr:3-dehydro-L-gulonate 2-dehydrogenase [Spirochaetales bacterium]
MRIQAAEIELTLEKILLDRGCPVAHAAKVAKEMTRNSLEGTYSHGINRFSRLVAQIDEGFVDMGAEPVRMHGFGALERYDGRQGLGIVNAWICMERAIELASAHGIGYVALRNTNHWLRAATYGYQACARGMAGICFSNTYTNMPAWGAKDVRLGNNPLVFAFPYKDGDILVDMAMSQYSYGSLEVAVLEGKHMPTAAGFDAQGKLTDDPKAVLESKRLLPAGFWKGAALSFGLDIFAAGISLGDSVQSIGKKGSGERDLCQAFLAINFQAVAPGEKVDAIVQGAVEDLLASTPDGGADPVVYPGQRMNATRQENLAKGIPVDERVWQEILAL